MQDEEGVSTVLLQFARNGDTLAPLSPPWTVVEYSVSQLALNRAVIKLFTANFSELNLHLFDVAGTGVLKAMTPAAVTTPESPNAIAFDPTGHIPLHDGAAATGISTYGVGAMSASAAQSSAGGAGLGMAVIAP